MGGRSKNKRRRRETQSSSESLSPDIKLDSLFFFLFSDLFEANRIYQSARRSQPCYYVISHRTGLETEMKRRKFSFSVSPHPSSSPQHLEIHHLAARGGGYWSHTVCIFPLSSVQLFLRPISAPLDSFRISFRCQKVFGDFRAPFWGFCWSVILGNLNYCSFLPFGAAKSPSRNWLGAFDCLWWLLRRSNKVVGLSPFQRTSFFSFHLFPLCVCVGAGGCIL